MYIDEPISSYEGPTTLPPRGDPGTHRGARDFRMMVGHGGGCIDQSAGERLPLRMRVVYTGSPRPGRKH